jgi:hypothetical protein
MIADSYPPIPSKNFDTGLSSDLNKHANHQPGNCESAMHFCALIAIPEPRYQTYNEE